MMDAVFLGDTNMKLSTFVASAIVGAGVILGGALFPVQAATVIPGTGDISGVLGTPVPIDTKVYFETDKADTTFTANVGSHTGPAIVTLTSNQTLESANGWAGLTTLSPDTVFHYLKIAVDPGYTFTGLTFAFSEPNQGTSDLTITGSNGGTLSLTEPPIGNGLNDLQVSATNGSSFTYLILFSTHGFTDIKQIQIAGLSAVPLPGALLLFSSAIGAGWLGLRRRRSQTGSRLVVA